MTDLHNGAQTPVSDPERPSQDAGQPQTNHEQQDKGPPAPADPGTHGRPSDDSDPGHS
ncbi:hypothetical protein [Deinococcus arcticus]|uniref:hypothetical protein n=1 Tax=Deinococcus arcticus TaxID=2136176 RepID=UPI001304C6E6|nr:hypothetical protein [Deinococcus arcticus]